ncbi:MAG: GNAT family N-acetyltransferase [Bdellovibrionales bacterium]
MSADIGSYVFIDVSSGDLDALRSGRGEEKDYPKICVSLSNDEKDWIGYVYLSPWESGEKGEAEISAYISIGIHQQRGIVSLVSKQIVKKAIEDGWLKRLYARTRKSNLGGIKIAERLGMKIVNMPDIKNKGHDYLYFCAELNDLKKALYPPEPSYPKRGRRTYKASRAP